MSHDNIVLQDRIKELSHTTGTGPYILDGKINGFSPFSDFYEYGDTVFYAVTDGTYYEVGSGEFRKNGSNNELTRFPFRSSNLNSGPYYVLGTSNAGGTAGQNGYYHPLYLTHSAAVSGAAGGNVHKHTFSEFPGQTFYMPSNHVGHAEASVHGGTSGVNYNASGAPFSWPNEGIKEVFITYPGKHSVFTGFGIDGYAEPVKGGIAFWGDSQILDYDTDVFWSKANGRLGIVNASPEYAVHVGGTLGESVVAASGFVTGGSGIYISGVSSTFSGGRQREPFLRNKLDNDTGTDAVFFLKGAVHEQICFSTQEKGTVLAGPPSGCSPVSCSPDYPTFRFLNVEDIPDLSSLYVMQDKDMGISTDDIPAGAVALYKESGVITYDTDHKLFFNRTSNRLGVNTASPRATLDVFGNMKVSGEVEISGNLNVRGDVTYVDSSNVAIFDKQIELGTLSGNSLYDNVDSFIDDGGVVVRSSGDGAVDTGDKKWTWKQATNTWTAQTSNGELLGINTSGLIFPDSSAISGAYHMGSGLVLHNGIELNVGQLFSVSGRDGNVRNVHPGFNVIVSGISGIQTKVATQGSDLLLTIDPSGLSGVFQHAIDNSTGYNWKIQAQMSGNATVADTVSNNDTVAISGASGIYIEHIKDNVVAIDGGHLSGVFRHDVNAAVNYNYWTIQSKDGTTQSENISSTNTLTVSGISGINTFYDVSANTLKIAPIELSGVLMSKIADATNYNYWTIESKDGTTQSENISSTDKLTVSGISGVNSYYDDASNTLRIAAVELSGVFQSAVDEANTSTAGSGMIKVGEALHMNVDGSGQLKHLMFYRTAPSGEEIRIGENADGIPSGVAIGTQAGQSQMSGVRIIAIGTEAAKDMISGVDMTAIGQYAGSSASGVNRGNFIGYRAGFASSGDSLVAIGERAGEDSSGNLNPNMIGKNAGFGAWETSNSNLFGSSAGRSGSGIVSSNLLGISAGAYGSGVSQVNALGTNVASGAVDVTNSNIIGNEAGVDASGLNDSILMGYRAGASTHNGSFIEVLGYQAAKDAANCHTSIYIGKNAGAFSEGKFSAPNYNVVVAHRGLYESTGNYAVNAFGRRAGEASISGEYANFIGFSAGLEASGTVDSDFIGRFAGYQAKTTQHVSAIGKSAAEGMVRSTGVAALGGFAAQNTSGVLYTAALGHYAAEAASGVTKMVAIGYKAATETYDSDYSILIGNYAGYNESRKYSTIINPRPAVNAGEFAGAGTDGVLDLMGLIYGIHHDANQASSTDKVVSIGKEPSDAASMANVTLGIRPTSVNHVGLKTYRDASPAADQIVSSTDQTGHSNTIVNKDGWLEMPTALRFDASTGVATAGGGYLGELYTHASSTDQKYRINKHEGACAMYVKGGVVQLALYGGGSTGWTFVTLNTAYTP